MSFWITHQQRPIYKVRVQRSSSNMEECYNDNTRTAFRYFCIGISEKLFNFIDVFWKEIDVLEKEEKIELYKDWLVKVLIHLEKKQKNIIKVKKKKLCKLTKGNKELQALVLERFSEHVDLFTFRDEIITSCENLSPDIINIANLMTLGLPIPDSDSSLCEDTKEVFEKAETADRNINDNS